MIELPLFAIIIGRMVGKGELFISKEACFTNEADNMWENKKAFRNTEGLDKLLTVTFYAFLCAIIGITIWIWVEAPTQQIFDDVANNDVWFGNDWHYVDEKVNVVTKDKVSTHGEDYIKVNAENGKAVIEKNAERNVASNEYLMFRTSAESVKIYINNELLYHRRYQKIYEPYAYKMYILHQIPVTNLKKGDVVRIELQSEVQSSFIMQYLAIGDRYSLLLYVVTNAKSSLFVCIIAVILIILNVIVCHSDVMADKSKRTKSLRWTSSFLVVSIVYISMDAGYMDIFLGRMAISSWLRNISFLMLPMPFIMYTQSAFFPGHQRYGTLSTINFVVVVLSVLGYIGFAFELSNAFVLIHLIIITGLIMCMVSFIQEKETPSPEVLVGYLSIMVTAVISIIAQLTGQTYPSSEAFGYGMISFSFCMLIWTVRNENEMRRTREEVEIAFIKRDKEEAEEANEQKSRFLSHMSHEIRTPLNAVLGMNELIMRETKDENIRKYAENIQSSGRTLLALINDVLDFSKIETGKMDIIETDYSLSSVLYDLILMVRERAKSKELEFKINVAADIPDVLHGDEIRIKQVVLNLLTNAVKYTSEGWIELRVFMTPMSECLDEDIIFLNVQVSDSGMGIKKEDLKKLFQEFERLDRKKNRSIEGTGLGLSITSKLVTLMDGEIKVESEYNKGSTFMVSIPQRVVKSEPIGDYKVRFERMNHEAEHTQVEQQTYPGKRVFVVDDNETNLEVIAAILEMFEIEVFKAGGGAEAIRSLDKENFDLILTDDMMPEMNGTELMQYIKSNEQGANYHTPIIVLTANAVVGAREVYMKNGFDDYMAKPIDIEILQKILARYLG